MDKKWRMVIFDFPVRFKKARDSFRLKLKQLGLVQLQKSIWVYPYPCEDELLFIANFYGLVRHVEILTVNEMLHKDKLLQVFNLNK